MEDSVFTKIIKGEIPCHKVHEDEKTIVFMDIDPVQPGMVLAVPKARVDHFMDLEDGDYNALMQTVRKTAQKMHQEFPDSRIAVLIEGLDVPHAHVKIFPFTTDEEFRAHPKHDEPNHAELAAMAQRLAW